MASKKLAQAFGKNHPIVLLLGQKTLSLETGKDPLLASVAKKRENQNRREDLLTYWDLFPADAPLGDDFVDWLATRADRIPPPEWLDTVAGVAWNAIFTSTIDTLATRCFRNPWRTVEPILSQNQIPRDPRRRTVLHVTYLFGRLTNPSEDQRLPRSKAELRLRRTAHAIPLLNRLPEAVTPLGYLFIEGVEPGLDWLNMEDLSGVLEQFQPGQVHWFGINYQESFAENEGLADLFNREVISTYQESLATVLSDLVREGSIALNRPPKGTFHEKGITIGDHTIVVPNEIWLTTAASIKIIDDTILNPLHRISEDRLYSDFRRFLGSTDDIGGLIEGIRRDFAIKRDFEVNLLGQVKTALGKLGRAVRPIILHGQSGTGKTVSLARLAFEIRKEKKIPVLFAGQSGRLPNANQLDPFCQFMEQQGASATVLILDSNVDIDSYTHLGRTLASRGRNFIIVGSSYAIAEPGAGDGHSGSVASDTLTSVSPILSTPEILSLEKLLTRFAPGLLPENRHMEILRKANHLLVLLYRLLPETRYQISLGLGREAALTEDEIRRRGKTKTPLRALNALGEALINAGLCDPVEILNDAVEEISGEIFDQAGQLLFYVMVPGRLGIGLPIDLLMRSLDREIVENMNVLIKGIDLFRWKEEDNGDILVRPRTMLEAKLICNSRLGGREGEIKFALSLLENLRPSDEFTNTEIQFALSLCKELGPNGIEGLRYSASYYQIANILTKIREEHGVVNTSLMLQEATLRRESLKGLLVGEESPEEGVKILKESVSTLLNALEIAPKSSGGRFHRSRLMIELAATYGSLARNSIDAKMKIDDVLYYYRSAQEWGRNARLLNPEDYYSVDVGVWAALDVNNDSRLMAEDRAELHADLIDAIESVDPENLDQSQFLRYQQRRQTIGHNLGNLKLEEDAFDKLLAAGSGAGILLRARKTVGRDLFEDPVPSDLVARVTRARDYLDGNWELIKDDPRCLNYFLRLSWIDSTGSPLFRGERRVLPVYPDLVGKILDLVNAIIQSSPGIADPKISFLAAVLNWQLGRYENARNLWRVLAVETDFSFARRIVKQFILPGPQGTPQSFHGQIQWMSPDGRRSRILVDELREEIDLFPRDFGIVDPQKGTAVPTFHIAFNFIGPIADPPRFFRS